MGRIRKLVLSGAVAFYFTANPGVLFAQSDDNAIVIGHRHEVHSAVLGEDRPILVHTPVGYDQSTTGYPVMYLLDGRGHFHHTSGTMRFLAASNRMPKMIVVAIPNTADRTHDLTPPTASDTANAFPTAGGADNFLRFIREELQPWVEREYRTAPYRVLVGHSFGGLFATHTLFTAPESFDAYLSISPSLWWDNEDWIMQAESLFEDHPDLTGSLYMTMGDEGGTMLAGAWGLTRILETSAPESFRWKWTHMPAEDHGSVPHRSTYDGLEWIFDGWRFPNFFQVVMDGGDEGLEEVDEHYAELSKRFGFEVRAPRGSMNQVGQFLLRQKRVDDAIRVLESNARRYPESPNVYASLGDAYDAGCRWEDSRENYDRAYRMASETSIDDADGFKEKLDGIAAKIAEGGDCAPGG